LGNYLSYTGMEYNHGSPGDSGCMWVSHLKSFASICFAYRLGVNSVEWEVAGFIQTSWFSLVT